MNICPRCGNQTDQDVCPICFTRIVIQPQNTWRTLTPDETRSLPPFTCPNCGGHTLLTLDHRYRCANCGVMLSISKPSDSPAQSEQPTQPLQPQATAEQPSAQTTQAAGTPDVTVLPDTPAKPKKKGFTRGKLIGILCGIAAFFVVGTGVALAIDGVSHRDNIWSDITEDNPFGDFGDFGDFSQIPNFGGNDGQNDPFSGSEEDPFGDESGVSDYPNGCSRAEYQKLEKGMTYAQISAIIGGDSANFYDTTDDSGRACTVFQWPTESREGYISVEFIDGKAVEFYAGRF